MTEPVEEEIQFDLAANLKRGVEYVGGNLKVTDKKMHFTPHSFNVQKKPLAISISDIKEIDSAKIMGISPNGILIHMKDDTKYKFVIGLPTLNNREEIIEYINGLIN